VIERLGAFPVPVYVRVYYQDNGDEVLTAPMSAWRNGEKEIEFPLKYRIPVKKIELGRPDIPDLRSDNNILSPAG